MENKDYFKQKLINLKDVKAVGFVFSEDLLSLIKDEELKNYIVNKYDLKDNIKIEVEKIDYIFNIVQDYTSKFSLLRLNVTFDNVTTFLSSNVEKDVIFKIASAKMEDETLVEEIEAESIYDSLSMFYEKRKLTQYVNYLKNNNKNGFLLTKLNESWDEYYQNNPKSIDNKVFRVLDAGKEQYVKSINSNRYKEYGIAETFVLTFLELFFTSKRTKNRKFNVSSMALSESKIDIIISVDEVKRIKGLGNVYSSISIRNED